MTATLSASCADPAGHGESQAERSEPRSGPERSGGALTAVARWDKRNGNALYFARSGESAPGQGLSLRLPEPHQCRDTLPYCFNYKL